MKLLPLMHEIPDFPHQRLVAIDDGLRVDTVQMAFEAACMGDEAFCKSHGGKGSQGRSKIARAPWTK